MPYRYYIAELRAPYFEMRNGRKTVMGWDLKIWHCRAK